MTGTMDRSCRQRRVAACLSQRGKESRRCRQASGVKASTAPVSAASSSARIAFLHLVGEAMLVAAGVAGSMLAIAIEVTDPRLHDVAIPLAGVVVGLWVVAAISLTLRALRRSWFPIPARISRS